VLDQERVQRDPEARVDRPAQRRLGLLRGPRPDDAETVSDAVHVGVDRDRRDAEAEDQHAVRRLRTDRRERDELLEGPRDLPTVAVQDLLGDRPDRTALRPVEPHGPHERLKVGRRGPREPARVRVPSEETGAGDVGVGVTGSLREDGADQDLERVLCMVAKVRPPPVPRAVELAEPVEQGLPWKLRRLGSAAHRRSTRAGPAGRASASGVCPGSLRSGSSRDARVRRSSPTR
jgi:hypothetical protein